MKENVGCVILTKEITHLKVINQMLGGFNARRSMIQHDENREREVQLLVKEVLSGSVQFYDNPNGPYEWTCPYCCAKLEGGYETILKGVYLDDLQHDHECAYIIAKGLKS